VLTEQALTVPVAGELVELAPRICRLTAPNPSVMTGPGTNTYLVGEQELVVIDPGPADDAHLDAIAAAAESYGHIRAIVVTHHHSDHAPGAKGLSERCGAPVLGWGDVGGFVADRHISDGSVVSEGDLALRAVHTPGHASDHLCFFVEEPAKLLFSGDHVMGGSTVVIAPPDGDMAQYLDSLDRLLGERPAPLAIAPGHGPVMSDPIAVISEYRAHRLAREAAVLGALTGRGEATVEQIVAEVYLDVPRELHPIARYSVWAHLLKLEQDGLCCGTDSDRIEGLWRSATGAAETKAELTGET
jgi:glyoxylase-like metal-dependent hydrolase (beta-lactamase superfamily II)